MSDDNKEFVKGLMDAGLISSSYGYYLIGDVDELEDEEWE